MKTLLIDHPTNRNLKLEIDVPPNYEEDYEMELIGVSPRSRGVPGLRTSQNGGGGRGGGGDGGGGGGGGGGDSGSSTNKSTPKGGGGGGPPPPPVVVKAEPVDFENSCLALVPELYDFVGMLANALSMHAYRPLLADPTKDWYEQPVPDSICVDWQFQKLIPSKTKHILSDSDWNQVVRHVFSAETYGGMLRSYNALTSCVAQGITLRQLIESTVTSAKFAELVAAITRQGAGGSAQPGRFYGSTYKNTPARMSYNVHAGLKFQERNAKQIAYLKLWFTAIKLYDKAIIYTQPDIPKSKYGFY